MIDDEVPPTSLISSEAVAAVVPIPVEPLLDACRAEEARCRAAYQTLQSQFLALMGRRVRAHASVLKLACVEAAVRDNILLFYKNWAAKIAWLAYVTLPRRERSGLSSSAVVVRPLAARRTAPHGTAAQPTPAASSSSTVVREGLQSAVRSDVSFAVQLETVAYATRALWFGRWALATALRTTAANRRGSSSAGASLSSPLKTGSGAAALVVVGGGSPTRTLQPSIWDSPLHSVGGGGTRRQSRSHSPLHARTTTGKEVDDEEEDEDVFALGMRTAFATPADRLKQLSLRCRVLAVLRLSLSFERHRRQVALQPPRKRPVRLFSGSGAASLLLRPSRDCTSMEHAAMEIETRVLQEQNQKLLLAVEDRKETIDHRWGGLPANHSWSYGDVLLIKRSYQAWRRSTAQKKLFEKLASLECVKRRHIECLFEKGLPTPRLVLRGHALAVV